MYNLTPVAKGEPYTSTYGEGDLLVKVRAIARNEDGTIASKRGVAFSTNHIQDIPAFVLNVYRNWDGRGELQYAVIGPHDITRPTALHPSSKLFLDTWTTITGAETK